MICLTGSLKAKEQHEMETAEWFIICSSEVWQSYDSASAYTRLHRALNP